VTEKLCAEVDQFYAGGRTLCYADLNCGLPYMRAVLDETLRLCPPVPVDPKEVVEEDVLPSGVRVQPGVTVLWSAYCMGRLPQVWGEDADQFRPARWLDAQGEWKQPVDYWANVPFQAGPRICLGRQLAYLECKAVLCSLFSKYTFTPLRGHVVTYTKSATLSVRDGVKVHVHLRT
jgi:cytochrome P450